MRSRERAGSPRRRVSAAASRSRWRLGQNFEGDIPIQLGVPCPIHLTHAAFADLGGDAVGAERVAGLEGH